MATSKFIRNAETHRGQGLGGLAEQGIPLCWEIEVAGKEYALRDALEDCVANFYLKQDELPFTAVALSLYLPPEREWANRYGERCSFADLAIELCSRRFWDSCCAGSHLLYAAMILYRADLQEPILTPSARARVRQYLRQALDVLVTTQSRDGSWGIAWFMGIPGQGRSLKREMSPPDDPESRLLATSHLAEWMLYLPPEFELPKETLERAGGWLLRRLEAEGNGHAAPLCPYGHAVVVVECLSGSGSVGMP